MPRTTTTAFRSPLSGRRPIGEKLALASLAFHESALIPRIYTAEGSDLSPPLHWQGVPAGTSCFALFLDDVDAARGPWVHWVLFDIPATVVQLPAGLERSPYLPNGARQGLGWGVDVFSRLGYHGPVAGGGARHRYRFTLSALGQDLALPAGSGADVVRRAMGPHVLAEASLTVLHGPP